MENAACAAGGGLSAGYKTAARRSDRRESPGVAARRLENRAPGTWEPKCCLLEPDGKKQPPAARSPPFQSRNKLRHPACLWLSFSNYPSLRSVRSSALHEFQCEVTCRRIA